MNKIWFKIVIASCLCMASFNVNAVVAVQQNAVDHLQGIENTKDETANYLARSKTKIRSFSTKVKKRTKRIVKRFFKKNNSFGNVLNSRKFRLGALLFLVGLIGAIVINVVSLAQIFGWLAGVIALAGLVLMIWSLIEYS